MGNGMLPLVSRWILMSYDSYHRSGRWTWSDTLLGRFIMCHGLPFFKNKNPSLPVIPAHVRSFFLEVFGVQLPSQEVFGSLGKTMVPWANYISRRFPPSSHPNPKWW